VPLSFALGLIERIGMAEYGEWNRKGATLSDVTAKAEYGVSRDFIIKGIETNRLEKSYGVRSFLTATTERDRAGCHSVRIAERSTLWLGLSE
jgi:hypothetical protein